MSHIFHLMIQSLKNRRDIEPYKAARVAVGGVLGIMLVLFLAACGASASATPSTSDTPAATTAANPAPRLTVVATTTVLADLARNVGGDRVEVTALVPPGADVHSYQSTPANSVTISRASLIVSNGFGLDDFLSPLLQSAKGGDALQVVAAEGLQAAPVEEFEFPGAEQEGEGEADEHEAGDPHFWLNPIFAIHYVERIRDGLVQIDPANAAQYQGNAEGYIQQLRELDQEIAGTLAQVPANHRHLVTFHDAYGYFGRRYDWQVSAFVPSDASSVTPGAIIQVMEQINQQGVPAVFAEPQFHSTVLEQTARDSGVAVGIIRSLVDNTATTYIEMMRSNAQSLLEHLR